MLSSALAERITSLGGEIRTGSEVTSVQVESGRATGVRTAGDEAFGATHAIVADVAAPHLFGRLVDPRDLPPRRIDDPPSIG